MNRTIQADPSTKPPYSNEQELFLAVLFRLGDTDLLVFESYEKAVLPILLAYGGVIERRIRTTDNSSELHIVRFSNRASFESYMSDNRRRKHSTMLKQSRVTVEIHEGHELAIAAHSSAYVTPLEPLDPHSTALLVIDVQRGFDDSCWGRRNNSAAEARIADLLTAWRTHGAPIYHAHHASTEPNSPLRPGSAGHAVKTEALPSGDEPVYLKQVNSAFIGTSLQTDLRSVGVHTLVLVGLTTNHCVSTTARMAGNLGFRTIVVADATAAFDRHIVGGRLRSADEVHDAALSDIAEEFATITRACDVVAALERGAVIRENG